MTREQEDAICAKVRKEMRWLQIEIDYINGLLSMIERADHITRNIYTADFETDATALALQEVKNFGLMKLTRLMIDGEVP